jgi:hypothetical protein
VEVSPLPVPETRTLYLAWTDTEGRIGLAWGVPRPGASFSTSWLDAGLDAERVALHVTDGTLLLAVMGEDSAGDGQLHVGHATAE